MCVCVCVFVCRCVCVCNALNRLGTIAHLQSLKVSDRQQENKCWKAYLQEQQRVDQHSLVLLNFLTRAFF